ncbi:alkaline phosphatase family protein [Sulfolobus tengchongensis]|uniref:Alkaline phosphatase family protein n=1 Tax=Sulfolobus tengchongensis TaxID=207809 RepID=A0AAX4KZG9_9CREN
MHNLKTLLMVIDGVSYTIFDQFRYNLETMNNLVENGVFGKLESVFPTVTPVALASLFTGKLPANHGITSTKIFVKGNSLSKPLLAHSSISLNADPIWYILAKNGYKVLVVSAPQALPDKWKLNNLLLFDPYKAKIKECSKGYLLNIGNNTINGVKINVENNNGKYKLEIIDIENNTLTLNLDLNEWTPPLEVKMKCKDKEVKGVFRLKGLSSGIYITPPTFLIPNWSNNHELQNEVWENVVKKYGMILDGDYLSLKSNIISFNDYYETLKFAYEFFYNYSLFLLKRADWDFAITYLPIVDNIQHLLLGVNDSKSLDYIFQVYKLADNFVKAHLELVDNIIICSDHGINKIKKRVYINRLLEKLNVLKISDDKIDWKKTKAYYGGGGIIRINLKEREKFGIVSKNEFTKLIKYLTVNLEKLEDPETGERIFTVIYSNETPASDRQGDIIIKGVNPKYSISSSIEKNDIFESVIPYNTVTADHGYYGNDDINGIVIFYGKSFAKRRINMKIIDIAPTILKIYGLIYRADGKIINEVFRNEYASSAKQKTQKA